jgi:hypothetical protein
VEVVSDSQTNASAASCLTIVTPDVPRTDDHEEAPPFDTRVVLKTKEKGKRV